MMTGRDMLTGFDLVVVLTVLPPPNEKPNAYDRCTKRTLASGRPVVEHVWGHDAPDGAICSCGTLRRGGGQGAVQVLALCKSLLVFERVEAERDLRDAEMAQTRQPERLAVAQARLERVLLAELVVNQAILETPPR